MVQTLATQKRLIFGVKSTNLAPLVGLALTLVACGGPPAMPARQPTPPPQSTAQVERTSGFFDGKGGAHLYEQAWRPVNAPVRASFVIVHGLRDHSDRYDELATHLVSHGIAVHAFDLRGHGHSDGVRVGIDSFDDYVDDLDAFVARVNKTEHDAPVFVFGFSMGGAIVTLYSLEKKPHLAGLILAGPALRANADGGKVLAIKGIAGIAPNAGVFKLDPTQFSRDPAVVQAGMTDPLVYQEGAPAHTAKELLGAIDTIVDGEDDLFEPILILHGGADVVTDPHASRELYERTPSSDRTLKIYPNLAHDLAHEPEKAEVIADIEAWTEAHIHAIEERAKKSDGTAMSHVDLAPPPFTAAQLRAGSKNGRMYTWKRETPKGTVMHEIVFSHVTDAGVDVTSTDRNADGTAAGSPETEHAAWTDLQKHGEFPRAQLTVEDGPIDLPGGHFNCMHYTVKNGDDVKSYYFAKDLAGPPVFFTVDHAGTRVMTSTLTAYRDADGQPIHTK